MRRPDLLWTDCTAGALVGVVVLALNGWLADLYALPQGFVRFMGAANLLYGLYSFSLAVRTERPMPLLILLVVANGSWAVACGVWAIAFWGTASWLGLGQLLAEAAFVGGLAWLEWRHRESLRHAR